MEIIGIGGADDLIAKVSRYELGQFYNTYYSEVKMPPPAIGMKYDLTSGNDFNRAIQNACQTMQTLAKQVQEAQQPLVRFAARFSQIKLPVDGSTPAVPVLTVHCPQDGYLEIYFDDVLFLKASHAEEGWSKMKQLKQMAVDFAGRCGAIVRETYGDCPQSDVQAAAGGLIQTPLEG